MFGFKIADENSREGLEERAKFIMEDRDREDLVQDKLDDMSNNELKEFVEDGEDG